MDTNLTQKEIDMRKAQGRKTNRAFSRQTCLAGAGVLAAIGAAAQGQEARLPEGESLLPGAYAAQVQPYANERASLERVGVDEMAFDQALRITNRRRMQEFWEFQGAVRIPKAIGKGQLVHVRFFARGKAPKNESGEAQGQVYFQQNSPNYYKDLSMQFSVGNEWKPFDYPFVTTRAYGANESALCFGTGFNEQQIEIGGVQFLRFGPDVKRADLPVTPVTYPGSQPDAPWRAGAAARIEQHRKGDLRVHVVDGKGKPVPGARVDVDMTKHAFHFSSVIQARRIMDSSPENEAYKKKVLELFNASGPENALKMPPWSGDWGDAYSRENALGAIKWLKEHGLHVRGHVMVWPSWRQLSKKAREMQEKPDGIPELVREHILDIGKATQPYIDEWDVINETRVHHGLMDLFGKEIMADWFRYTREAHPTADLYINDYGILGGGAPGSPNHVVYLDTIKLLMEQGAPIDGIGFQSHFGGGMPDPATVVKILDLFGKLELDMRITEFDVDTVDEQAQANYTRDFMTAVFSHPGVVGFQMWGFWEKAHWRPRAAMYRDNWEEKPNGAAYRDLVFNQWWTKASGETDAQGEYALRGFKGEYDVRVTTAGGDVTIETVIGDEPGTLRVEVK